MRTGYKPLSHFLLPNDSSTLPVSVSKNVFRMCSKLKDNSIKFIIVGGKKNMAGTNWESLDNDEDEKKK